MPATASRLKRVVVDVDTQKQFFENSGIVCVQNHRQVLANILRIVNWARLRNIRMISTVQILPNKYPYCSSFVADIEGQRKIGYTFRKRHTCFDAEDNTDLLSATLEQYDQIILEKRCFDPFREPRADRILSELQADEFILVGALTEGAVKATALGLLRRHKNVTVLVDATGSYDVTGGQITLRLLLEWGGKLADTRTFLGTACLQPASVDNSNRL
jgi:nicotinamidase-related amidase